MRPRAVTKYFVADDRSDSPPRLDSKPFSWSHWTSDPELSGSLPVGAVANSESVPKDGIGAGEDPGSGNVSSVWLPCPKLFDGSESMGGSEKTNRDPHIPQNLCCGAF